jgi:hypothetical protein
MNQHRTRSAGPLCVVLACFSGRRAAGRARRDFGKAMHGKGTSILDEVVVVVNAKHRARVHDPHRVLAGTLTAALTWGLFGLCSGGGTGLVIWGVLGAICGGAYGYFSEHILTKTELKQVGAQLPANSSAILAYVETGDADAALAHLPADATAASAAVITPDLTARTTTPSPANGHGARGAAVTMLLVRYAGEHGARKKLSSPTTDAAQVELVFEVPSHGRTRVVSPTAGVAAWAKSDLVSWGGFGVVFGLIVGFAANGGTFGILEEGVVKGLLWGVFGLAAGALYGLWVGRATSARRIRGLHALLPPDSATALVWLAGGGGAAEIAHETRASSAHVALDFRPSGDGAVLQAS